MKAPDASRNSTNTQAYDELKEKHIIHWANASKYFCCKDNLLVSLLAQCSPFWHMLYKSLVLLASQKKKKPKPKPKNDMPYCQVFLTFAKVSFRVFCNVFSGIRTVKLSIHLRVNEIPFLLSKKN